MEKEKLKEVSEIGDYNKTNDYFYDTSTFSRVSYLTKIVIYINQEKTAIIGIELGYNEISTGIFKSPEVVVNQKDKIEIPIKKENPIISIKGSFIASKIVKLVIEDKQGNEIGYNNEKDYDVSKLTSFIMKSKQELTGFKFAFNKELKYLQPVYKNEEDKIIYNEEKKIYETKLFGKQFGDSIKSSVPESILKGNYILKKVSLYHDGHLLIGVKMDYAMKENPNNIVTHTFGKIKDILETIYLNNDEIISSLIIRSGDMIDGILMNTNQSNMLLSGGNGGGLHLFDIKQLEEATGKKLNFLGFEGSYAGCVHQIKALFRTSE